MDVDQGSPIESICGPRGEFLKTARNDQCLRAESRANDFPAVPGAPATTGSSWSAVLQGPVGFHLQSARPVSAPAGTCLQCRHRLLDQLISHLALVQHRFGPAQNLLFAKSLHLLAALGEPVLPALTNNQAWRMRAPGPNLQLLIGASCCGLAREATPPRPGCQLVTSRGAKNPGKDNYSDTEIWTCALRESWRTNCNTQHRSPDSQPQHCARTDVLFQALQGCFGLRRTKTACESQTKHAVLPLPRTRAVLASTCLSSLKGSTSLGLSSALFLSSNLSPLLKTPTHVLLQRRKTAFIFSTVSLSCSNRLSEAKLGPVLSLKACRLLEMEPVLAAKKPSVLMHMSPRPRHCCPGNCNRPNLQALGPKVLSCSPGTQGDSSMQPALARCLTKLAGCEKGQSACVSGQV